MTPEQLKSLGQYALWAFIGAIVATGLQLAASLQGTDAVLIRPLAATFTASFFGSLATVVGTSRLTRFGSESIAHQVDDLKSAGVAKSEMVVLSREDAVRALAPLSLADRIVALSLDDRDRLVAELERRSASLSGASPLISQPPTWLPPEDRP